MLETDCFSQGCKADQKKMAFGRGHLTQNASVSTICRMRPGRSLIRVWRALQIVVPSSSLAEMPDLDVNFLGQSIPSYFDHA